jgi:hypothetical protein
LGVGARRGVGIRDTVDDLVAIEACDIPERGAVAGLDVDAPTNTTRGAMRPPMNPEGIGPYPIPESTRVFGPCTGARWLTNRFEKLKVNPSLSIPSMLAGLSTSAAGLSRYEVPVIPIAMLRESYAVGSGLALASAGVSTTATKNAVISLGITSP